MPNIILDEVASGYKVSTINDNFQKIEDALNSKVLYRGTDEPNSMGQALDANNYPVINVRTPQYNKEAANKLYVDAAIEQALSGVEAGTVDFELLIDRVGDAEAAITEEKLVRASEDEALASSLTQLNVSVEQVSADIIQEATARATADSALASSLSALSVNVAHNAADIITEQTVRANQYTALASDITSLQANVGNNTAAISNEQIARVNADGALSSSISSVSSDVDALESSVTVQMSTVNNKITGIESQYTVKIDNDGYVSGFGLISGPKTSDFTVRADMFKMVMPGYGDYIPFAVGPSNVIFNGITNWNNSTSTSGSNLLFNAGLNLSNEGYNGDPESGRNFVDFNIAQGGARYGTFYVYEKGRQGGGAMYVDGVNKIPVEPGKRYEVSCYTGSHRCRVAIDIDFWSATGAPLGGGLERTAVNGAVNDEEKGGGVSLSSYKRIGMFAIAPTDAAYARFIVWKNETKIAYADSYLFATLPYFGRATEAQTELSTWTEGVSALNTKITPSNVTTFIDNATINTAQIADAAIQTAKIGVAQIDTLRVGTDQITVPRHYYVSGPVGVDLVVGGTCVSGYIDPKGSKVTLIASVTAIAGSGYFRNMTVTIFDPLGQIVSTCGIYTSTANKYYYTATAIGSSTLTGTYTVYAGVGGATGPVTAHDSSIIMLATKR